MDPTVKLSEYHEKWNNIRNKCSPQDMLNVNGDVIIRTKADAGINKAVGVASRWRGIWGSAGSPQKKKLDMKMCILRHM